MSGFLFRWLVAFVVLAAAYNPTQYNYVVWVQENFEMQKPLAIGLGVMLGLVLLFLIGGTIRTMGFLGILLVALILGLLGYILQDNGLITLELNPTNIWAALGILSLVIAGALSWRGFSNASRRAAQAEARAKAAKA